MMSKMYRELSVWKRIDDTRVVRFRCFEEMETHLFCVQNADFYTTPLKADVIANSERLFLELLESFRFRRKHILRCADSVRILAV
jgi:hypothetical protein